MRPDVKEMAALFDYTLLRADATAGELKALCQDAKEYGFAMVAINSAQTRYCKELLKDSDVHVGAAISFPLGQTTIETKLFETRDAIANGADEIDYVINIGKLKDKEYGYIKREMQEITGACRDSKVVSKVIFENCYLTDDEKRTLCEIALEVKPDFIKTSTGFGTGGATIADVKLMRSMVGDQIKVKASGGIRTLEMVLELIDLGVGRIGLSAGKEIIAGYAAYLER